jgi:hypothetical protein
VDSMKELIRLAGGGSLYISIKNFISLWTDHGEVYYQF